MNAHVDGEDMLFNFTVNVLLEKIARIVKRLEECKLKQISEWFSWHEIMKCNKTVR